MSLVEEVYKITENFPKKEIYGLSTQIQRAAISIPSNVAEGFRRKHPREYKQFLCVSLGSCGELETQVEISKRLGYIDEKKHQDLIGELDYICKMIQTLINKLNQNL